MKLWLAWFAGLLVMAGCVIVPEEGTPTPSASSTVSTSPPLPSPYEAAAQCDKAGVAHTSPYSAEELENLTTIESPEKLPPEVRTTFFQEFSRRLQSYEGQRFLRVDSTLTPGYEEPGYEQDTWRFWFQGFQTYPGPYYDSHMMFVNESHPTEISIGRVDRGAVDQATRHHIQDVIHRDEDMFGSIAWLPEWGRCVVVHVWTDRDPDRTSLDPYWIIAADLAQEKVLVEEYRNSSLETSGSRSPR